jgi:hypothetical protein
VFDIVSLPSAFTVRPRHSDPHLTTKHHKNLPEALVLGNWGKVKKGETSEPVLKYLNTLHCEDSGFTNRSHFKWSLMSGFFSPFAFPFKHSFIAGVKGESL